MSWVESILFGDITNIQKKNTNCCKGARALKQPEGYRVDATRQLN